jgi:hypothetical protein
MPSVTARDAPSRPVSHSAWTASAAMAHAARSRTGNGLSSDTFHVASASESRDVDAGEVLGGALRISASICSSVGPWFERPKPNAEGTTRVGCRAPQGARRPDNGRDARGADADTCTDICG